MTLIAPNNTWRQQEYTAAGGYVFVVPAGVYRILAMVVGSGGGGGGNGSGINSYGGGGGGAETKQLWLSVDPGDSIDVTIPAGGAPGVSGVTGTAGTKPADTTVAIGATTLISTDSGGGGQGGSSSNTTPGAGGAGGGYNPPAGGAGGSYNDGQPSDDFFAFSEQEWVANGASGGSSLVGGRTRFLATGVTGSGAAGQWPGPAGTSGGQGQAAGYGGGGNGGDSTPTGGAGQSGYVRFLWQV